MRLSHPRFKFILGALTVPVITLLVSCTQALQKDQPQEAKISSAAPEASAADAASHFDPATLSMLTSKTGLNAEQWDNIMKLVNKPEQDDLKWYNYYGYCENIGDGRGYTIGIFGATTGGPNDDGPDAPALFKEYDRVCGASSPSTVNGVSRIGLHGKLSSAGILTFTESKSTVYSKVKAMNGVANWRTAMWNTFYNVYISYAVSQAKARGFNDALTIGSFTDTALNEGGNDPSRGSLKDLLARSGSSSDEKTFLTNFYNERKKVVDASAYEFNQPPNGQNRVKEWSTLLSKGEYDLKNCDSLIVSVTNWTMK